MNFVPTLQEFNPYDDNAQIGNEESDFFKVFKDIFTEEDKEFEGYRNNDQQQITEEVNEESNLTVIDDDYFEYQI